MDFAHHNRWILDIETTPELLRQAVARHSDDDISSRKFEVFMEDGADKSLRSALLGGHCCDGKVGRPNFHPKSHDPALTGSPHPVGPRGNQPVEEITKRSLLQVEYRRYQAY